MAHWAELDDNNVVLRVTVGSNEEPDEGYQWLVDNLGGRWVKTSFNTSRNTHLQGGVPFRGTFAAPGYLYQEKEDRFIPPCPSDGWVFDEEAYCWKGLPSDSISAESPIRPSKPDEGFWVWDEATSTWVEDDTK